MKSNPLQNRRFRLAAAGVLLLAAGALVLYALAASAPGESLSTFAMGSYVQQTVYGRNAEEAAAKAAQNVTALENLISWRVEGSDIDRLNKSGPEGVTLSPQAWQILKACDAVSRNSHGAFDPTIGPVSRLWNFDADPQVPEESQLAGALAQVDYHALSLPTEYEAVLAVGKSLDLGAVGKGTACDEILRTWEELGVSRGVAAVGGSVGLYGQKPWGKPWTVAVRDPAGSGALGELSLQAGCVSTSGSYEKTFTENGRSYHHLLDPKTGFPAESGLVSVTVWRAARDGLDGTYTDALATACFVLGVDESLPLLELFGAGAVFVTEDGGVAVTEALESAFTLTAAGYTREVLP